MHRKTYVLFILVFLLTYYVYAQEADAPAQGAGVPASDQQIDGFSLAGYGDKGKKAWDLSGKSADIFENTVKLNDLTGNLYGEKEDVKLTADKGDFDKTNGKIHVQDNVVITTSSGAKLTTDSLDWDRTNSTVSTKDIVKIKKENMYTVGKGAFGQPDLNKMNLEKDVSVEIEPQKAGAEKQNSDDQKKIVITCDGPLQVDYEKNIATFNNNVKVDREDSQIYCDLMDVYFSSNKNKDDKSGSDASAMLMGSSIDKIVAKGNVKTVRAENITYSQEAVYSGADKKITLTGRPKLIIYSTEDFKSLGGP